MTNHNLSQNWIARSRASVWHPCTQMQHHERLPLVPIARGEGAWLIDFDGNRYLDAVSSWWTNLFGHTHPRLKRAISAQLEALDHVMLAGFTHAPAVELAEALRSVAPAGLGHVTYASDGASATEIALKMAAHYWLQLGAPAKNHFLSVAGSYHGETVGALSVTDVPLFRTAYAALVRDNLTTPNPAVVGNEPALAALEAILQRDGASLAAFIIEPLVQGANAMVMHSPEYLRRSFQLCKQYKVLFIADEIMTGFGRTGTLFACEQAKIRPDFLCLSKGITGGTLPLSCVLTTDEIFAAFYDEKLSRAFLHSHSYTGNPLACAAASEVLKIFADENVISANQGLSAAISQRAARLAKHPRVKTLRQCGMIWAFDVDVASSDFARRAFEIGLDRGVLLRPIGNTIYWMPPYCLSEDEIDHLSAATLAILNTLNPT